MLMLRTLPYQCPGKQEATFPTNTDQCMYTWSSRAVSCCGWCNKLEHERGKKKVARTPVAKVRVLLQGFLEELYDAVTQMRLQHLPSPDPKA